MSMTKTYNPIHHSFVTTEPQSECSGFQGLGGGAYQQAFCNSARIALLATISVIQIVCSLKQHSFGMQRKTQEN